MTVYLKVFVLIVDLDSNPPKPRRFSPRAIRESQNSPHSHNTTKQQKVR